MTERCWATTYDIFASEYGYTIDQFFKMPIRLMNILIERIMARNHNRTADEKEFQMRLRGSKMTIPRIQIIQEVTPEKVEEIKIEDDKVMDILKKRLEEKQRGANG